MEQQDMEESPTKTEKEGIKEKLERLSTLIQKNKIGEVTKMLNEDHNFLQQLQDKKLYISYQHEHSPLHEASQYLLPDMIKLLIGTFGLPLDCKSKEKIGKDEVLVGPLHRAITGNTVSHIASVKALLSKDGDPENGWVTESFDEETKADLLKTANERKCTKVAKVLKKAFVKEADLEETVKKLNNELDVKTTQVGNLTITVAELEQELKAKSKLLQEISAKVNQKQDSKEKAMLELEDMRKAKNKLEDTVTKLKKELNLKEGKVTKLKENFDLLEQELKAKSKLLQEISAKVKQEQESKERAYRELEETRKTEAEMGETVTKLERQLNLIKIQQEENITELKGNVAKCEQELETKSRLLQEISAKVKQEQESKEKAKLEMEEMRKTKAKLEETVTKLEEQLNAKIQQEGIKAQLEQELKTKSKLLKETVDKYEQKLKVKEAKLESEVVNREEKLEKLQNEAQINYDKLDNELSESKALADKATRNFEEVSCQLEEVRSELVEVRSKLKEVNRELEEVKYKFKEANSELEGVKSRYEEANCKLGEITTELENSKSELEVANRKLEDVNNELKEVKSELEEIKRKSDWDVMKDEYPFRKPFVAVIDLEGNNFFKPDITILGEHFPVKKTTLTPKNLAQLEKNYREKILIKLNDRGNGYDGLLLFIFGHGGTGDCSNGKWGEFLAFRQGENKKNKRPQEFALLNENFIHPFNTNENKCPGLRDLPQVFVVTSCRGGKRNNIVTLATAAGKEDKIDPERPAIIDRYVLRPTVEDCLTNYDKDEGSGFIKTFCELVRKGLEINTVRSQLVHQAGLKDESQNQTFDIPTTSHNTLRKRLFLSRALGTDEEDPEENTEVKSSLTVPGSELDPKKRTTIAVSLPDLRKAGERPNKH